MQTGWMPLRTVLEQGPELILNEAAIWQIPLEEFGMDCTIVSPLEARLSLMEQKDGLLVRGSISGAVRLPCNRCLEDSLFRLRHSFDSFEPFPADVDNDPDNLEVDEYFIRWSPLGPSLEINPGNLAWEEFTQALPLRPLCRQDCAGLCPNCGQNLNLGSCACALEQLDPRLEKLRGLTLANKGD